MTSRPFAARAMLAWARLRRANAPARHNLGWHPERTEVDVVGHTEFEPLAPPNDPRDAAFEWGCLTEVSSQPAFAMLMHSTESHPPGLVCQTTCRGVVAGLVPAGLVLRRGDIARWLLTALGDDDAAPDGPGPAHPVEPGRRAAGGMRLGRSAHDD